MSDDLPKTRDIVNGVFGAVKEYSKFTNELPVNDYDYHMAFPGFRRQIKHHSESLVEFMEKCFQLLPAKRRVVLHGEVTGCLNEPQRAAIMEAVDSLLENVDSLLDELKGRRLNAKEQLALTFGSELQYFSSSSSTAEARASGRVVRPQLTFEQPVDNSTMPFCPVYYDEKGERHKGQPGAHPFAERIANASIPGEQLQSRSEIPYLPLLTCKLTFVDAVKDLEEVVAALLREREIAVDLEHHDFYSYQGFTCLMQISTRTEDIIVDCLKLRSSMYLLAPVFLNPNILKVFHGAREDVRWLQKDFGLYLVNFFDTSIALQKLHMPHSLAFAVDHFCQVKLNKKYQTADWRIRPIPAEMVLYARQDTHFLLYVYDRLKTLLLNSEGHASVGNPLVYVFNESRRLSLEMYEKPRLDPDTTYKVALGRSLGGLSPSQMQVARDLFNWRDAAARDVDDSPTAVMHLSSVLAISTKLPTSANEIMKCCSPVSVVVRTNVMKLVQIVKNALGDSKAMQQEEEVKAQPPRDSGFTLRPVGVHRPLTGTLPSIEQRANPVFVLDSTHTVVRTEPSTWFAVMRNLPAVISTRRQSTVALPGHKIFWHLHSSKRPRDATETAEKMDAKTFLPDDSQFDNTDNNNDEVVVSPPTQDVCALDNADGFEEGKDKEEDGEDNDEGKQKTGTTDAYLSDDVHDTASMHPMGLEERAVALRQKYGTGSANRKRVKLEKDGRSKGLGASAMKSRRQLRYNWGYCFSAVAVLGMLSLFFTFAGSLDFDYLSTDGLDGVLNHKNENYTEDACSDANTCLDCLFPKNNMDETSNVTHLSFNCFWCAAMNRCLSRIKMGLCEIDREDQSCPAVLHSVIPNNFHVILLGIKNGGAEALIQLAQALHVSGFRTTLDARRRDAGGRMVPFFHSIYMKDPRRAPQVRWFKDYKNWLASAVEGDVYILTETWSCPERGFVEKGARAVQWRLTVWSSLNTTYCTITGHTNFITMFERKQSKLALIYPYISRHIVEMAQSRTSWHEAKKRLGGRPLLLLDSDLHFDLKKFKAQHERIREIRRAFRLPPSELYELYKRAMVGIDLNLPGAERFIFEAALFDVCVIVDDSLVGGWREDVPLPEEFRVPAGDLNALNEAIDRCIRDYDKVIPKFSTLKQFAINQETIFMRQVRRYFSNSVHVMSVVCSQKQANEYVLRFILNVLLYIPFATVEIRLAFGVEGLSGIQRVWLQQWNWLVAVRFVEMSQDETSAVCEAGNELEAYGSLAVHLGRYIFLPNRNPTLSNTKRSLLTLFAPLDIIIVDENIVHYISSQLAALRDRHTLTSYSPPFFILESHIVEEGTNVTLMAMWTADVSSLMCNFFASGELPLVDGVCRRQRNPSGDTLETKLVVLRDGGENVALATRVGSLRELKEMGYQHALHFMCMHEVWKKFVGGC